MEITLVTTFDLSQDITLDAYNNDEKVGTAVIKDNELTYYNLITNKNDKYDNDNIEDFISFVNEFNLKFKKVADRKWIKYNPNPQNRNTGDCSIRAYCKVEGIDWNDAYDMATKLGKEMSMICDDHKVVDKILTENFGYTYVKGEKGAKKKTVNEFAIEHPEGTYIGWVSKHVVAIVNGYYYDSWDSGNRKMNGYYKK
jgi:hypothetical protein